MPESPAPAAPENASLVGLKFGNYRLERIVGRGRMGVVYLATDEALLRPTAVKVLSWSLDESHGQDPVQWFIAEARLVARINHPLVVQIYSVARHGEHRYIAMEYIDGASAEALVSRYGPMTPGRATELLAQAASALQAAHESGVIHRDVKPANLLVAENGTAKLTDFGMALHDSKPPSGPALRVGTPYFTAPEIWMGAQATPASDIYALGATYFSLLTGRPPYVAKDIVAVQEAHLKLPVPDPRETRSVIPADCAELARRMLAKTPKERFGSAKAVAQEASRILDEIASGRAPARAQAPNAPGPPEALPRTPAPIRAQALFESLPAAPAGEPLASRLGFFQRPFVVVDGESCPYRGDPFAGLVDEVVKHLDAVPGAVLLIAGGAGSGRTTLCRRAAIVLSEKHTLLGFDLSKSELPGALLEQLRRAAATDPNAPVSGRADDLRPLLERIASERQSRGRPPILVLDGIGAPGASENEIAALIGGPGWSWTFSTVLVGTMGLSDRMRRAGLQLGGGSLRELTVPPLDGAQVAAYVSSWLRATRSPGAPPLVISPDALLLVAHRARGRLGAVNCIAENMLILAASEGRRVVSSWDAWAASADERWSGVLPVDALPRRPSIWPTKEAIEQLDACRAAAGLPLLSPLLPRP